MKHITFYLDFVSPYAWLAFERLPEVLEGLGYTVAYKPVLLGALLQQHANPGPAGIAPKRDWTYRHVTWLGHAQGTPLAMPARHPFNPVPLLRLALACSDDGHINRYVAGTLLREDGWRLGLADGSRLPLPGREDLDASLEGRNVQLGVRPEHLLCADADEGAVTGSFAGAGSPHAASRPSDSPSATRNERCNATCMPMCDSAVARIEHTPA